MYRQSQKQICVAVDLTSIRAGGENGGHKIAVLNYLAGFRRLRDFRFILIGSTAGRSDLLPLLAKGDRYLETPFPVFGAPVQLRDANNKILTTRWYPKILQRLGAHVLYSPFGTIHYSERGLPFVTWIADLLHRDCPMTLNSWQIRAREDGFMIVSRESVIIQASSEFIARKIHEVYGVSPNRLVVLPPIPQDLARSEKLKDSGKRYFFYPANFWAHKNHRILLFAYREYISRTRNEDKAWNLVLTGHPGPEEEQIKALAQDLGISNRVQFLGYLSQTEYADWFTGAGCLVFPSLYEGFGMPLVEAMRLHVPIIASKSASIPEICGDAFHAIDPSDVSDIAQAMETISQDESVCRTLVSAGQKRQMFFNESHLVDRLADTLRQTAHTPVNSKTPSRSLRTNLLRLGLLASRYARITK